MAQNLFSQTLLQYEGEINNAVLENSLNELKAHLNKRRFSIFSWDDGIIAVPVSCEVELPPLGNFEAIDIRSVEPVLFLFDLQQYPSVPPKVVPDRLDFPKDRLAHLYVAKKGKPPEFCLVRGNLAEWYANKRLPDLYIRVSNWLRDAASGELSENGEQFDPIRLEGYSGTFVYDYDTIVKVITEKCSYFPATNFAIVLFERITEEGSSTFRLIKVMTPENTREVIQQFNEEKEKDNSIPSKKKYHFGYIVWSEEGDVFKNYEVHFPHDWESLKDFFSKYHIAINHLEKQITTLDLNVFLSIPIIAAVRRPKQLIGFSDNIELFNFTLNVDTADVNEGKIIKNVPALFHSHIQPLSRIKAKRISGFSANLGTCALVAGCGALGSKIVMHLARSGTTNFMLADPDYVSSHNLVRHALLGNVEGLSKAVALKREIRALFPYDNLTLLIAGGTASSFLDSELIPHYNWIFDFTASPAFFLELIKLPNDCKANIVKAFISDFGKLGILFVEGENRNPRIDDLQAILYSHFTKLPAIGNWLQREKQQGENKVSVTVGVGCNSETIILADDVVSLHSAYFSGLIKNESAESERRGKIYLNIVQDTPFFSILNNLIKVPPMVVLNAVNDPSWQIRIKSGIIEVMKKEMGLAMPSETGGVFIGTANHKTKVIHVIDVLTAPLDSQANPVCFFRGIEGLPESIAEVNEMTGNQLGYIGEWHTHPFGPNNMSGVDVAAVKKFKKEFAALPTPLPVFLFIITPDRILPYVF